ncbi:Peptidoglycan/LPS O-acetylase OafA/YrhL, contains acyltransferase and SGNH-hydrolase domains [bacterium JGI 053]|nr:Peptidoglycan/LPS O-acetylase OafA/YrhL, contains acyltransferase and SGNH-hydrolase domains [bacterium JGI 053]
MRRPVLPAVDGLRFAAAMHVVLIHSVATRWLPQPVYSAVRSGYTSTSALFILSGFILTWVYAGGDGRLSVPRRGFLVARLSRLFPLLVLSQLLVLPLWPRSHAGTSVWVPLALGLAGVQAWWPRMAMVLNTPAWAVSVFCLSYLTLPWLLDRFRALSARGLLLALFAVWWLCMLPGIAYHLSGTLTPLRSQTLYTFPLLRFPEFVFGVLLSRWLVARGPLSRRQAAWAASLGAAVWLGWIAVATRFPIELIHNGLLAPAQGLLIVGLAYGGGVPARVLAWRPLRKLGERSLAIYLLHLPILAWLQALDMLPRHSRGASVAGFLAFVAITLAVSVLVSDYFVAPASRWLRRRFGGVDSRPRATAPRPALADERPAAVPAAV